MARFPWKKKHYDLAIPAGVMALALVLLVAVILGVTKNATAPAQSGTSLARLVLDFGDGQRREFEGELVPRMSVLDALAASAAVADIPVSYAPARGGTVVAAIGQKGDSGTKHWVFTVNGKTGENPATYVVKPGDVVLWRYQ